jgi:hypothetical protein
MNAFISGMARSRPASAFGSSRALTHQQPRYFRSSKIFFILASIDISTLNTIEYGFDVEVHWAVRMETIDSLEPNVL